MSSGPRIGAHFTSADRRRFWIANRMVPLTLIAVGATILFTVGAGAAIAPVGLGTAGNFAVLAGMGVTNTGPTTITGDVGTFPTPAETGFGSVTLHGADHAGDAVTQQAKTDLVTAYNQAAGSGPAAAVPTELGGRTLTPGVYGGPTLGITGTLTLDTQGDPAAVFIFQASSTLITASSSSVVVLSGATACNVFWQVGSSATLGTNSHLIGSVLALTSITATTGATVTGRLLARNGAVTLDSNTITIPTCTAATTTTTALATTTTASGATTTTVPGATTTTVPGATTTTLAGATTTTAVAATTTTTAAGAASTTVAATTIPLSATTVPGGTTIPGGTTTIPGTLPVTTTTTTPGTTTTGTFNLAVTGSDRWLPILGGLAMVFGFFLLAFSGVRSRRTRRP
jgi:type VI secretion system secreted protein VgrG